MLLRDNNQQTVYPNVWGLIGGGIKHGETPLEAMCRECQEEIGLSPNTFHYIGKDSGGRHLFHANLTDQEAKQVHLGREGQKLSFFRLAELTKLDTTPKLKEWIDFQFPTLRHLCENPNPQMEQLHALLIDKNNSD